jgi:hypothetical protein
VVVLGICELAQALDERDSISNRKRLLSHAAVKKQPAKAISKMLHHRSAEYLLAGVLLELGDNKFFYESRTRCESSGVTKVKKNGPGSRVRNIVC